MMNVTLICVGNLKEKYFKDACAEYNKRLGAFCKFNIVEVNEEKLPDKPSQSDIDNTIKKEGERIIAKIPKGAMIFAMCIEGTLISSEQLADKIQTAGLDGKSELVFIIGGSWGLSDEVKRISNARISMSRMTFPHQLARVLLCEQIYRAFQINSNGKYHK
ncbi:MAG: 23S rRNA (pseudouridine(1915)-N(3))-methyltransferase RlmH [Pseudoruminococcus massiliensis]|jgi:23S rRNA (pseudouridine1915-N3)-methyltransferase|uniref:23S rRNA (pseudouridine(1915)-N(3))-methyltransferase RlmH n=1 Tax=Pseudoruminococcus massiliensis TaxID=2086583 RepID=UPI00399391B1|nr:23S rRNA (pseudouridine(1915)-N(3))-methyltransferase RlmH [Oscillospiraceae bacterium]